MSNAAFLHVSRADFAKRNLQALGRLKTGEMNKTEAAYAEHLEAKRLAGEVVWWKFEAFKLRLADNTFLTPDFAVMQAGGELEMHDCKGSTSIVSDDARVKTKVAAEMYPLAFFFAYPKAKKLGGGWSIERVGR